MSRADPNTLYTLFSNTRHIMRHFAFVAVMKIHKKTLLTITFVFLFVFCSQAQHDLCLSSDRPEEMFESRALIVITDSQFSPETVKVMKDFWSQAGTTVKIAIDSRYETIKDDLKKHNLNWKLYIHEINVVDFDFVIFVGSIAPERCKEKVYQSLVVQIKDLERGIGAIGCAVLLLVENSLLTGYSATGCPEIREHIMKKGGKYSDEEFVCSESGVHTCKESAALECAYRIAFDFHVCKLPFPEWEEEVREKLDKVKQSIKVHH